MKAASVLLTMFAFGILLVIAPQPANATYDLTSPYSITSFAQTNPADGNDFWPDGYNQSVTNLRDYQDFAGIGAFVSVNLEAGDTKGTSGDYGYLKVKVTGADDWDGMYTNRPSFTAASLANVYFEIRYKGNNTNQALWRVHGYTGADRTGTAYVIATLTKTTTWTTYRALMPSSNILESVSLEIRSITGSSPLEIDYDYMLFTPSNAGGWQHDCSGTGNISSQDATVSSDGDKVTITATASPGWAGFWIDWPTTTTAALKLEDYPFLELSVVANAEFDSVSIQAEDPDSLIYDICAINTAGLYHLNIKYSMNLYGASYCKLVGFYLPDSGNSVTLDWVALYAIANFTTTVTGADVNDTGYVSSNTLQITKSSATLFQFDHDPAISVAAPFYETWNISTSAVSSSVGLSTYISPTWTTKDYVTSWTMPNGGSTDVSIRVFSSCAISSVKFIDIRAWNEVAIAIPAFWLELYLVPLEGFFILAGLVLIPISTLYLVHGGREEMSNDKVFFFLVLFFVGWALLIGGIMP